MNRPHSHANDHRSTRTHMRTNKRTHARAIFCTTGLPGAGDPLSEEPGAPQQGQRALPQRQGVGDVHQRRLRARHGLPGRDGRYAGERASKEGRGPTNSALFHAAFTLSRTPLSFFCLESVWRLLFLSYPTLSPLPLSLVFACFLVLERLVCRATRRSTSTAWGVPRARARPGEASCSCATLSG